MADRTADLLADPRRLTALHHTGLLAVDRNESFDRLCELAARLLDAPTALVSLVDEDRQVFPGCIGLPEPYASRRETPLTHSICQYTLGAPGTVRIADTAGDPRLSDNLARTDLGVAAYVGVPLRDGDGNSLGSFCVIDDQPRDWTDDQVATLESLAHFVMAEIDLREAVTSRRRHAETAARLAEQEQTRRQRAESLLELARALSGASTVEEVATAIARRAGAVVGAAFSNFALERPGGALAVWHDEGLAADVRSRWADFGLDDSTPLGAAILSGRSVQLGCAAEIAEQFPRGADDAAAAGFQALTAVPIGRRRAAIGFAWLEPTEFDEALINDLDLVAELCDQAVLRAQATDRQRAVSRELQRVMLPQQLPAVAGVDLAARYEPSVSDIEVGGDWYDVGHMGAHNERVVIAVGDVVGRGLPAAVTMGRLRHAFAGFLATTDDLEELVTQLDTLAEQIDGALLTTAAVAEFEPATGTLRVVSAGHVPLMIRRADGSVDTVPARGAALGLATPSALRAPCADQLGPGDALVLYTDGLIEQAGEHIDASLERLASVLRSVRAPSADELCDALLAAMAPGDNNDDIALLALRVPG